MAPGVSRKVVHRVVAQWRRDRVDVDRAEELLDTRPDRLRTLVFETVELRVGADNARTRGADVFVLLESTSKPQVEQHWEVDTWPPDGSKVTGSPNRG